MDRVHRGWRLCHADAVARRRLEHGEGAGLGRAALFREGRRRLWADEPDRLPPGRPRRAGHPCQLLRGRRLRPLGRRQAADGVRVGGRGGKRAASKAARSAPVICARCRQGSAPRLQQMFGDVWEWTGSAYLPYPGFKAAPGAVGEYNGKFMCNQFVLRGGSCATPEGHVRRDLSQFLLSASALAVHRPSAGGGRMMEEGDISLSTALGFGGSGAAPCACRDAPPQSEFAEAVLAGFARRPRSVPCRFFYDARGSELFEEITKLEEYYPTRAETALLEAHGAEIAALAGEGRILVEFGSGSSRKTSLLLSALGARPRLYPDRHRRREPEGGGRVAVGAASRSGHPASDRRLHRHARAAAAGATQAAARLLLRLDHRQSHPCGGAELPCQCRAAARARQRLPARRRSEEERADPDPRL